MEACTNQLCPFKRNQEGGFGLCSGQMCMADFEYEPYPAFESTPKNPSDPVGLCRMMMSYVPQCSGCR